MCRAKKQETRTKSQELMQRYHEPANNRDVINSILVLYEFNISDYLLRCLYNVTNKTH